MSLLRGGLDSPSAPCLPPSWPSEHVLGALATLLGLREAVSVSEMDQPSPRESHPGTFLLPAFGAEGKNRKATSSNYNSDHFSLKTNKSPTPQENQNSLPLTSQMLQVSH